MERQIDYFRASRIVQMKQMMRQLSNLSTTPVYADITQEGLTQDE